MGDEAKPTLAELAYVGDVAPNAECPFCQNRSWAYLQSADGSPWSSSLGYERDGQKSIVPAIPLTCEKCGFVRFHDLAMIRVKMREAGGDGKP